MRFFAVPKFVVPHMGLTVPGCCTGGSTKGILRFAQGTERLYL